MIDWLTGWLAVWLASWLTDWWVDWMNAWLIDLISLINLLPRGQIHYPLLSSTEVKITFMRLCSSVFKASECHNINIKIIVSALQGRCDNQRKMLDIACNHVFVVWNIVIPLSIRDCNKKTFFWRETVSKYPRVCILNLVLSRTCWHSNKRCYFFCRRFGMLILWLWSWFSQLRLCRRYLYVRQYTVRLNASLGHKMQGMKIYNAQFSYPNSNFNRAANFILSRLLFFTIKKMHSRAFAMRLVFIAMR